MGWKPGVLVIPALMMFTCAEKNWLLITSVYLSALPSIINSFISCVVIHLELSTRTADGVGR